MTPFNKFKKTGVKSFKAFGSWAFDEWKRLNDTFFYGENIVGEIVWRLTPKGRSLGYYSPSENLICLHKGLMRPVYPTIDLKWEVRHINKRLVSDVLLHEMIHQKIHQTGGWAGKTSHNNDRFVEEVNRIAKLLGIDIKARVIEKKSAHDKATGCAEPGCLTLKELSHFPYGSRSNNYYYSRS